MTTLLIDIGNTRLKWGLDREGDVAFGGACNVDSAAIESLCEHDWSGLQPESVMVSCVGDAEIYHRLQHWLDARLGVSAHLLRTPPQGCGIRNAYTEPTRLGSDRWAAMVAAFRQVGGTVCVVGCGTAVTLDVIAADGQHLGGLIIPGYHLMQTCLHSGTRIDFQTGRTEPAEAMLGRSTEACIQQGVARAVAGMVATTLKDLQAEMPELQLILTGGDAERLQGQLGVSARVEPQLVLHGLAIIHRELVTKGAA